MAKSSVLDEQIMDIIQNNEIAEQSELQDLLRKIGFDIPQATLSRRLKKLNVAKVGGTYMSIDPGAAHVPRVLHMQISDFGLIVLHTLPGHANGLAYYLDQKYATNDPQKSKNSGLLGTIAGDDTLLLIVKSKADVLNIVTVLKTLFPYLNLE
jgi:transcriptional regulator of arginine metabolism